MKKWILSACLIILSVAIAFYFLIPAIQNTSYQTVADCPQTAAARKIIDIKKWKLWWPGQTINDTSYTYQSYTYTIGKVRLDGIEMIISNNNSSVKGFFQIGYIGQDSTRFNLTCKNSFSTNPVKRFAQYFQVEGFQNNAISLLENIQKYFDNQENIYGLNIITEKMVESSFISLKNTFDHYPTTEEIYSKIELVKDFVKKTNGEEGGFPMAHVENIGEKNFELMVAVPTKHELPGNDKFQLKRMHTGYVLTAKVKGGNYAIINGEKELANYKTDYRLNSPAIPFQSLITNRLQESDTTKWITKLYYPVLK